MCVHLTVGTSPRSGAQHADAAAGAREAQRGAALPGQPRRPSWRRECSCELAPSTPGPRWRQRKMAGEPLVPTEGDKGRSPALLFPFLFQPEAVGVFQKCKPDSAVRLRPSAQGPAYLAWHSRSSEYDLAVAFLASFPTIAPTAMPNTHMHTHMHTHSHSEHSFLDIRGSFKRLCLSSCCSLCLECSVPLHSQTNQPDLHAAPHNSALADALLLAHQRWLRRPPCHSGTPSTPTAVWLRLHLDCFAVWLPR